MFSISVTLYTKTQRKTPGQHSCAFVTQSHSPLDVETASLAAKGLHHHELARDKKPVERGGRYVCTLHISFWVQVLGLS